MQQQCEVSEMLQAGMSADRRIEGLEADGFFENIGKSELLEEGKTVRLWRIGID